MELVYASWIMGIVTDWLKIDSTLMYWCKSFMHASGRRSSGIRKEELQMFKVHLQMQICFSLHTLQHKRLIAENWDLSCMIWCWKHGIVYCLNVIYYSYTLALVCDCAYVSFLNCTQKANFSVPRYISWQ